MLRKVNIVLPALVLGLCLYDLFINSVEWPIEIMFFLIAMMNLFLGLEEVKDKKKLRGSVYLFTSFVLVTGMMIGLVG